MNLGDFFRHITLVFASYLGLLGIPMSLPMPPQPEGPALMRVAPADCTLFVQWCGQGESAPDTLNRTCRKTGRWSPADLGTGLSRQSSLAMLPADMETLPDGWARRLESRLSAYISC